MRNTINKFAFTRKIIVRTFVACLSLSLLGACNGNSTMDPSLYVLNPNLNIPYFPSGDTENLFEVKGGLALKDSLELLGFIDQLKGKKIFRFSEKSPDYFVLTGFLSKDYCERNDLSYQEKNPSRGLMILRYYHDQQGSSAWAEIEFLRETKGEGGIMKDATWWLRVQSKVISVPADGSTSYYESDNNTVINYIEEGNNILTLKDKEISTPKELLNKLPVLSVPLNLLSFDASKATKTKLPMKYDWDSQSQYDWSEVYLFGRIPQVTEGYIGVLYTLVDPYKKGVVAKNCNLWVAFLDGDGVLRFDETKNDGKRKNKFKLRGDYSPSVSPLGYNTGNEETEEYDAYGYQLTQAMIDGNKSTLLSYTYDVKQDARKPANMYSVTDEINYTMAQSWTYQNKFSTLSDNDTYFSNKKDYCMQLTYRNDALQEDFAESILNSLSEPLDYIQPLAYIPFESDPLRLFAHWLSITDLGRSMRLYLVDKEGRVKAYREVYTNFFTERTMEADSPVRRRARFTAEELYEVPESETVIPYKGHFELIIKNEVLKFTPIHDFEEEF